MAPPPPASPTVAHPHPIDQFLGDQHEEWHGGVLVWPGHPTYRLPVRNQQELQRLDRVEMQQRYVCVTESFAKVFDMTNPADIEYHSWVTRRAHAGWFKVICVERRWDQDDNSKMRVYLEWTQSYAEEAIAKEGNRGNYDPSNPDTRIFT